MTDNTSDWLLFRAIERHENIGFSLANLCLGPVTKPRTVLATHWKRFINRKHGGSKQ